MKTNAFSAVAALALSLLSTPALADQLTLDQIVALSTAGIGDDAVIAKIKTSGSRFDLSPDQMLELKRKGVSGPVIAAMLSGGAAANATTTLSVDALDPMIPHAPGVYLVGPSATKMIHLDPTMTSQAKTGGIIGYAFTGGLASMSIKAAIANESAKNHVESGTPQFYFFFDESNPDSGRLGSTWLAGVAMNASSPNEFTLVRLTPKSGRREARVGSLNIAGAKTGVMDKDRVAFTYDVVRPGVYKVTPSTTLPKGEYGFLYSLGGGAGGAMNARIFDFAVD